MNPTPLSGHSWPLFLSPECFLYMPWWVTAIVCWAHTPSSPSLFLLQVSSDIISAGKDAFLSFPIASYRPHVCLLPLCDTRAQIHPSDLPLSVSFLPRPQLSSTHPYFIYVCFLELLSEMLVCFQDVNHLLEVFIIIKPSILRIRNSHSSEGLPWSEQKDLRLEKQLLEKWHHDRMSSDSFSGQEVF